MRGRLIAHLAALALAIEQAGSPDEVGRTVAAFRKAIARQPIPVAAAVLELYRRCGGGREAQSLPVAGPLGIEKLSTAGELFDTKARKAVRGAAGDPSRAAELLWTWARQERSLADAIIRLFLATWLPGPVTDASSCWPSPSQSASQRHRGPAGGERPP